ncbi:MAG: hypothetical protein ACTSYL_01055 [Candidatus Thorarchaeota archaeon]
MDKDELTKFVLPVVVVVIVILAVVILAGLASSNPDGFEWALFVFSGAPEPSGGFEGIWAFLGEGPIIEAITGIIGVVIVLIIGMVCFKVLSRQSA